MPLALVKGQLFVVLEAAEDAVQAGPDALAWWTHAVRVPQELMTGVVAGSPDHEAILCLPAASVDWHACAISFWLLTKHCRLCAGLHRFLKFAACKVLISTIQGARHRWATLL